MNLWISLNHLISFYIYPWIFLCRSDQFLHVLSDLSVPFWSVSTCIHGSFCTILVIFYMSSWIFLFHSDQFPHVFMDLSVPFWSVYMYSWIFLYHSVYFLHVSMDRSVSFLSVSTYFHGSFCVIQISLYMHPGSFCIIFFLVSTCIHCSFCILLSIPLPTDPSSRVDVQEQPFLWSRNLCGHCT